MSGSFTAFAEPTQPNLADYLLFIRQNCGIGSLYLPDSSLWITTTFTVATTMVNAAIAAFNAALYTIAVYDYGADRLINFALDVPGQSYFSDLRRSLGITGFSPGLITASSDQGTSQSRELPDWVRHMTLADLQLTKTPYGRAYLSIAQAYGSTVWGLT